MTIEELALAEGRAYVDTIRLAERYDRREITAREYYPQASRLLTAWNAARDALRGAVLDRFEEEAAPDRFTARRAIS